MQEVVDWLEMSAPAVGVAERTFVVNRRSGSVPGVLWLPARSDARPPLVLLGHGGSGHKRSKRIVTMAHWFAAQAGIAALAIDGPYHGERVPASFGATEYQSRIAAEGPGRVIDRMVGDWLAAVDAVATLGTVDTNRLGYHGLSMATRYGLPTAVALGDRLQCAVFGKFGLEHTPLIPAGLDTTHRIQADAPRLTAPTLFHVQWDDGLFPRRGQLALFDLIGSADKQLIAYTGTHDETHPSAMSAWQAFVASHLGSAG